MNLVSENKISMASAKELLVESLENNSSLGNKVSEFLANDKGFDLDKVCEECVAENPEAVSDYLKGKEKALQSIIGGIMAKTKGRANVAEARKKILNLIEIQSK